MEKKKGVEKTTKILGVSEDMKEGHDNGSVSALLSQKGSSVATPFD